MHLKSFRIILPFLFSVVFMTTAFSQKNKQTEAIISDSLTLIANKYAAVGKVGGISVNINTTDKIVTVTTSEILSQIPFRPENVARIYNALRAVLSEKYTDYKEKFAEFSLVCISDKQRIEDLIPNNFRDKANIDTRRFPVTFYTGAPLVTNLSKPYQPTAGLQNRHIALWQSHGFYFDQKRQKWVWQRPVLFNTVEDLYTQSFVLPYLVPMLENAGANVLLPRERDVQLNEVIVDNDVKDNISRYRERSERKSWKTAPEGFANLQKTYKQGENPFRMGTYRYVQSISENDEQSDVQWVPNIPEEGFYAVYVSYKTVENSTTDARYTVYHKGGKTTFKVNQTMNGGTWTYLGTFKFDKGRSNLGRVELTNLGKEDGKIITADAVKFGGGMGNIARYPNQEGFTTNNKSTDTTQIKTELIKPEKPFEPAISTYPRFTEGARYWLQWAGVPDSVYSRTKATNDYSDDFQSRGFWVNYLVGGSVKDPQGKGLNVPVDMAFAFHSDAGTTKNDSIIGTLGICTVNNTQGFTEFKNGVSRWASHDLVDVIQTQIVNDVRKIAPEWSRRGIWNKSYSEARVPEVPTMLLELLSHQNFADMRYGLDPRFRFTVSRAIYKGMLKYLSYINGTDYVVQPLPVKNMACKFAGRNKVELTWTAVNDSLEPTATPEKYVIYIRTDNGDFDNGAVVKSNRVVIDIQPGKIYSFKVTALNKGGESFPSEILSAYRAYSDKKEVMIVNGFDRVSAPVSFESNQSKGGFLYDTDGGMPYIRDISFTGSQYEFDRTKPWVTDENQGFGASARNYESMVIAGNTFDYPAMHGKAIKAAGFSFVSCSLGAVLSGETDLQKFSYVDLILGKQKQTYIGNAKKAPEFKTFPLALQQKIRAYCQNGGNLLVSGAYLASDMYNGEYIKTEERFFLENILNVQFKSVKKTTDNKVTIVASPLAFFHKSEFSLFNKPNEWMYHVESVNVLEPTAKNAITICRYNENNQSAGVAYSGKYKVCALGFPLESIKSEKEQNKLVESVLLFFASGQKIF